MNRFVIKDIPLTLTSEEVARHLRVNEDDYDEFMDIYNEVFPLLAPCVYVGIEHIRSNDGRRVTIGDQTFESRILAVNLKDAQKVYPYIGTSGRAAYEKAESYSDSLYKFWAHGICEMALGNAMHCAFEKIKERLNVQSLNAMNPGSLQDFPISQQKPLFDLLKNVEEACGVTLTPTYLMIPIKSGSGIWYESDKHYANCMMCPRVGCPNRRAPYEANMFESQYAEK